LSVNDLTAPSSPRLNPESGGYLAEEEKSESMRVCEVSVQLEEKD